MHAVTTKVAEQAVAAGPAAAGGAAAAGSVQDNARRNREVLFREPHGVELLRRLLWCSVFDDEQANRPAKEALAALSADVQELVALAWDCRDTEVSRWVALALFRQTVWADDESAMHVLYTKESEHPYRPFTNLRDSVHVPGATKLTIAFDKRSSTESNSDVLSIFSDEEMTRNLVRKLSGARFESFEDNHDRLFFRFSSDASRQGWGFKALVRAEFPAPTGGSSDDNRFRIVDVHDFRGVGLLQRYMADPDDACRRFAAFTIANLTMSERCKTRLFQRLGFDFFLDFPAEMIAQRTAALCLSELMEEEDNRKDALQGAVRERLLTTLTRMARSSDDECQYRAVKCLTLLASAAANCRLLLHSGMLEVLHFASKTCGSRIDTAQMAWEGMKSLSEDTALLLDYAQSGPRGQTPVALSFPDFGVVNRRPNTSHVRVGVRVAGRGKVYCEAVVKGENHLHLGVASGSVDIAAHPDAAVGDLPHTLMLGPEHLHEDGQSRPIDGTGWMTGSVVGFLIDLDAKTVAFTIDGRAIGSLRGGDWWQQAEGLYLAGSFSSGASAEWNIGLKAFRHAPSSGIVSLADHGRTSGQQLPDRVHFFDRATHSFVAAMNRHGVAEQVVVEDDAETRRRRVVSWILSIRTMAPNDTFLAAPEVEQSPTPYPRGTTTVRCIRRPGANALVVEFERLRLPRNSRDSLAFFADAECTQVVQVVSESNLRPVVHTADAIYYRFTTDVSEASAVLGCGFAFSVTPLFGSNMKASARGGGGASDLEFSDESVHPYLDNTNETRAYRVPGANAVKVWFDASSRTEANADYVAFFLDRECSQRIGNERYSGTNFPGINGIPPLVIPAGEFFMRWITDGSVTYEGWVMRYAATVDSFDEVAQKPGAVVFETPHNYPDNMDHVWEVSIPRRPPHRHALPLALTNGGRLRLGARVHDAPRPHDCHRARRVQWVVLPRRVLE